MGRYFFQSSFLKKTPINIGVFIVLGLLGGITVNAQTPPGLSKAVIHYYDTPSTSIKNIAVDLVYFVPSDTIKTIDPEWKKTLEKASAELKTFYEFQLENLVRIDIKIHPKPIVGSEETSFYNGTNTNRGNPNALMKVEQELRTAFPSPKDQSVFHVLGIIYEGVGASGSGEKRTFLLAREYLTRSELNLYGMTFLAHEFSHTLGMPDLVADQKQAHNSKAADTVIYENEDIMGAGRYRPLSRTFLSNEMKQHLISSYAKNTK